MSSQSEIVVTVKAGQTEMPVRAGGDFIFVKEAARNVRVIVDGQAINMGRGDKRRIERSEERKLSGNLAFDSFEVSNLGDDDLRLVFVVGEGDYNSQIVTGELSVSDYIQTNLSGTSKTNPTTLKKRVGLVSMVETPIVSGEKQNSGEMPDLDGDGSTACVFWHDGKFWAMGGSKIGSFTKDSVGAYDEVKTIDLTDVTLTNINHMRGAVCKHGNVYFVNGYDLFTFNMGLLKAKLLVEGFTQNLNGGLGLVGDDIYQTKSTSNFGVLSRYNIKTGVVDEVTLPSPSNQIGSPVYGTYGNDVVGVGGYLYIANNSAGNYYFKWSPDKPNEIAREFHNISAFSRGMCVDPYGRYVGVAVSGQFVRVLNWPETTLYGELYVQNGADAATRKPIYLFEPLPFYSKGSGFVIFNLVAKILNAAISGASEKWRDYVNAVTFTDGDNEITFSAGTQSFARRGLDDDFGIFVESDVEISVLPEFVIDASI